MPYLIGQVIGAAIGIYLLSGALEWAIFKRILADPVSGKIFSVMGAFAVLIAIRVAFSDFGPTAFVSGLVAYLPGALFVSALKHQSGLRARRDLEDYAD